MTKNSTVVSLRQPEAVDDPLTAVLRNGGRRLLSKALRNTSDAKASQTYLKFPDQAVWLSLSIGYPRIVVTRPVS